MSRVRLSLCRVCGRLPEAISYTGYCFGCWPGGPVTPPPCLVCGSLDYYNTGKCRRCHMYGRPPVESCPDCLAWGTVRKHRWLCDACVAWRVEHPMVEPCLLCRTATYVAENGVCRLCHRQGHLMTPLLGRFDLQEANRYGQQLFLANLLYRRRTSPACARVPQPPSVAPSPPVPSRTQQLALFPAARDLTGISLRAVPPPADERLYTQLTANARDCGARLGWSVQVVQRTCWGLRVVLGLHDAPGSPIPASSVIALHEVGLPAKHVRTVLAEAGLLLDDREPALVAWFERQLRALPEAMVAELRIWFDIMLHGRSSPPRRRPRNEISIRLHTDWALPVVRAWARQGYRSLREIAREDVARALEVSDHASRTGQGLRSVFRVLKLNHVLFADPTARMQLTAHPRREPLPADTEAIRALLDPGNPARAAVAALVAFHGLRTGQVRELLLTDIRDGRLHIDGRVIPLAHPVRERLAAYLDMRSIRWPNTANPHLFINYRTALELREVGIQWVKLLLGPGLSCRLIREDRILAEALATRGDPRRLHDMFGLSIAASQRYTNVVDDPSLTEASLPR